MYHYFRTFGSKRVMLFCILVFTLIFSTSTFARNVKILSYGDSLVAGLKRTVNGIITCPSGVSAEPGRYDGDDRVVCYGNGEVNVGGYQPVLEGLLTDVRVTPEIKNFGFSGIDTVRMVSTMNQVFNAQPDADFILIFGGVNDAFVGRSTSTVISNLGLIVEEAKRRNIVPILTTVTRNTLAPSADIYADRYSNAIRTYAANNDVLLTEARNSMFSNWDSFHSGDQVHLGANGDNRLAELYFQAIGIEEISILPIAALMLLLLD